MTRRKPRNQHGMDARGGTPALVAMPGTTAYPEPEIVFDPELFEELRGMVSAAKLRLALEDLATTLKETFAERPTVDPDRDRTFQLAHMLTGRAGLMGFTALQDACVLLQEACATQAPFSEEYAKTCRISLPTLQAIASLLKRSS